MVITVQCGFATDHVSCRGPSLLRKTQHTHSQHGSGAVNLVVSRKSGGVVRAPGNAGHKRVKKKRGRRSAAAVAARIERGYLKRTRTAGGTACVNNHESMTSTPGQRVRAGVVDTRVIGKPDQSDGDPVKYVDWSFKLRSYLGAVDQEYQQELTTTETSSTPRLHATLGSEESALSTQMYYILVMTTAGAALDKCHNAGANEGFEAWKHFVMEGEPKLRTRYVGLMMNVLGYRFRDDIPTKLAAFERTVHDYENQSTKTADDDIKIRVTMLGMEDMRVKDHLIRNSVRIKSWNQMREEILEITLTQQYISRQCSSERIRRARAKTAKAKAKAKARTSRAKGRARMQRTNRPKRRSEKVLLLQLVRPREGRVQKETERPCRCRGETGGSVAISKRDSGGRAVAVLTPRRERHTSTFVIAMPCANSETSCESSSEQGVRERVASPRQKHHT